MLVALEILICLALVIAIVVEGGGPEGLSTATVTPSAWFQGAPALGLMFAVSGFLGVEGRRSTAMRSATPNAPSAERPMARFW